MFTGIVRHVGQVVTVAAARGGRRLTIDLGPLAEGVGPGDSVCVSGTCLTVCALADVQADFDVISETLSRTTLGDLRAGGRVNLERALGVGGALDGHIVQGHVDGLAEVRDIRRAGEWRVELTCTKDLTDQMVPKGSAALDGVSLTLAEVADGRFCVALIPETLSGTTLGELTEGRRVNVETDILGKYVRRYLEGLTGQTGGGLTIEKLRQAGFA